MSAESRIGLGVAILMIAVAGCVRYRPEPISPRTASAALEARRLSDPGLARFMAAANDTAPGDASAGAAAAENAATENAATENAATENAADDPAPPPASWDLRALTLAGLYFSPDLAVARADWGVARAAIITAGARPNPDFSGDVAALTHGARSPSVLSLLFDIPFVIAGKRGIQVAEARSRSDSVRLGVATAAWQARDAVRTGALDLWSADRAVALASTAEKDEAELVKLLDQRVAAGETSSLDLTRERVALDRARAALRDARSRLATARVNLAAAIGVPTEALDSVSLALDDFASPLPSAPTRADARAAALLSRSDLRAALAGYAATQAALQLEVARQYPDVSIGPGLHWEPELTGLTVTPSLRLPMLDRNRGPIREAQARRTAAAASFTRLQAGVLADVDRALARYTTARPALAAADSVAARQAAVEAAVAGRFRAGEADRVALVGAELERVTAEQEQLAARTQALKAVGDLESAIQRPLLGDSRPFTIAESDPIREGGTQ